MNQLLIKCVSEGVMMRSAEDLRLAWKLIQHSVQEVLIRDAVEHRHDHTHAEVLLILGEV